MIITFVVIPPPRLLIGCYYPHRHHFISHHLLLDHYPMHCLHCLTAYPPTLHSRITSVSAQCFVSVCSPSLFACSPSVISLFVITPPFCSIPHPTVKIAFQLTQFIATSPQLIEQRFTIIVGWPMTRYCIHGLSMLWGNDHFLSSVRLCLNLCWIIAASLHSAGLSSQILRSCVRSLLLLHPPRLSIFFITRLCSQRDACFQSAKSTAPLKLIHTFWLLNEVFVSVFIVMFWHVRSFLGCFSLTLLKSSQFIFSVPNRYFVTCTHWCVGLKEHFLTLSRLLTFLDLNKTCLYE